jgi:uncharacterized protein
MKHAPVRALLATVLSLWLTTSAWAGYEEGKAAYLRGDYATALKELIPLANEGDTRALNSIGVLYHGGLGVQRDYPRAVRLFRLAAEQGNAKAQFNLGFISHRGEGVPQNIAEALRWYRLAAEQGIARAKYTIGHMYRTLAGVPKDLVQAYMWFNLAALSGYKGASLNRDLIAKQLTPDEISKAQRFAGEWLGRHGE